MDVIEVLKAKTDGMPDEVVITLTTKQGKTLLDQLEAERQRADDADARIVELEKGEKYWFEEFKKAEAEIAALREKYENS